MELLMPILSLAFWGAIICFFWFWWSPRSFGKFWGTKYMQVTDGGKPAPAAGLKTLWQLLLMVIVTIICFNIHPFSMFIIAFVWIKWLRSVSKTSSDVPIKETKDNEPAS